ncbi:MAG TPA: hypothetical protein VFM18_08745 [Methanosarcina sp.]|nr:hypothetical protein [Methanosarcina sp.]
MQFSPLLVASSIIEPLRYYFSSYGDATQFLWDNDETKRTIEIGDVNDFNKIPLQERPRVLVNRGVYQINKVGLSDNMAQGLSIAEGRGLRKDKHMLLYTGTASVIVEARNKGTCELLTDMVTHFIAWSRGPICDTQGFKNFADNLSVSECSPTNDQDDTTFQVTIQLPYVKEEHWVMRDDGQLLKNYLIQTLNLSLAT